MNSFLVRRFILECLLWLPYSAWGKQIAHATSNVYNVFGIKQKPPNFVASLKFIWEQIGKRFHFLPHLMLLQKPYFDRCFFENLECPCFKLRTLLCGFRRFWKTKKSKMADPFENHDVLSKSHDGFRSCCWSQRNRFERTLEPRRFVKGVGNFVYLTPSIGCRGKLLATNRWLKISACTNNIKEPDDFCHQKIFTLRLCPHIKLIASVSFPSGKKQHKLFVSLFVFLPARVTRLLWYEILHLSGQAWAFPNY